MLFYLLEELNLFPVGFYRYIDLLYLKMNMFVLNKEFAVRPWSDW